MRLIGVLLAILIALLVAPAAAAIRVGAAISLKDAVIEIGDRYEQATGEPVEFVFASSGQLLGQIRNGAPIDVFLSAAPTQVEALQAAGLVDPQTRRDVVRNELVLVVPTDAANPPRSFAALAGEGVRRLAIGEPTTVPAGRYAAQVLSALGLTDTLVGKLVYGTNVRQVLAYVQRGEVTAGIVYATDARQAGDSVRVVATADPATHEPITYPGVVVSASPHPRAARRFLDYLGEEDATAVFIRHGFQPAAATIGATP